MQSFVIRCIVLGWYAQKFGMKGIDYTLLFIASLNDFE